MSPPTLTYFGPGQRITVHLRGLLKVLCYYNQIATVRGNSAWTFLETCDNLLSVVPISYSFAASPFLPLALASIYAVRKAAAAATTNVDGRGRSPLDLGAVSNTVLMCILSFKRILEGLKLP